jgi:hypothetical protein
VHNNHWLQSFSLTSRSHSLVALPRDLLLVSTRCCHLECKTHFVGKVFDLVRFEFLEDRVVERADELPLRCTSEVLQTRNSKHNPLSPNRRNLIAGGGDFSTSEFSAATSSSSFSTSFRSLS